MHDQQLNTPFPVPDAIDLSIQSSIVTSVLKQHNEEENYVHEISQTQRLVAKQRIDEIFEIKRTSIYTSIFFIFVYYLSCTFSHEIVVLNDLIPFNSFKVDIAITLTLTL